MSHAATCKKKLYIYIYIYCLCEHCATCILTATIILYSSSSQSQVIQPPEPSLLGVMGVSDWDFLCPPSEMRGVSGDEEEDTSHRPSLDDFDGEIAVFQVH